MLSVEGRALPCHVPPAHLAGATVVVTDVLRAATSMIWALEAGPTEIIPVQGVSPYDIDRAVAERLHCCSRPGYFGSENHNHGHRNGTTRLAV
jgi:hypothetical protein